MTDYSVASGKTFEDVVGINHYGVGVDYNYYHLRMTIGKGKILTIWFEGYIDSPKPQITIPPNTTPTHYGNSINTWFGFLEDTTISAIEMYNTD